jgi:hypothetical protein
MAERDDFRAVRFRPQFHARKTLGKVARVAGGERERPAPVVRVIDEPRGLQCFAAVGDRLLERPKPRWRHEIGMGRNRPLRQSDLQRGFSAFFADERNAHVSSPPRGYGALDLKLNEMGNSIPAGPCSVA